MCSIFLWFQVVSGIAPPYGKDKFSGVIKWLPLMPGSSSSAEMYPNFLLSHFPSLAHGPSIYNSGAHATFPVSSPAFSFFVEVFGCLLRAITVSSAIRGTRKALGSVEVQEWSHKEVRNLLQKLIQLLGRNKH